MRRRKPLSGKKRDRLRRERYRLRRLAIQQWASEIQAAGERFFIPRKLARLEAATEMLEALSELLDACPTSCEDRRLIEAQRKAEAVIARLLNAA